MLKKINRILKLVGLNLVRAKRRKVVAWQTLERYTPEDKVPPTTSATVPLADYMGDSEWHNAPGPTGNVGCCGGPVGVGISTPCTTVSNPVGKIVESDRPRVEQPNSDNKITGPTS